MLHELAVENYAVVDRLRVGFHAGLNLLTGETGSGKSIVVDALGLLLGARASSDMIRSGEERARVSGVFDANDAGQVLKEAGFDESDGELLIEREIFANGKGRAYLNNRPVTLALLKALAPYLGDIHGQHDQQLLFDPAAQLSMLDAFAAKAGATHAPVKRIRELFACWRRVSDEIAELEGAEQQRLRMMDLWQFQRNEIEAAVLRAGEDVELEAERRIQQNAGRLLETASAAYDALYESPESALSVLRTVAKKIDELARIDPEMQPARQSLDPALIAVQEVAYSLRDYLARVEANPARLEEIESRLAAIDKLKRKYGSSTEEILNLLDDVRRKIGDVETSGERLEHLKREHARLASEYDQAARALTSVRREAARDLADRIGRELKPLAMERTVFRIDVEPAGWSDTGADRVEFLVSPNAGEEPRALARVASGGELSRIALALKTCLIGSRAEKAQGRSLVFDEIDAGIGGRAAEGVARRLKALAAENQVLCVTHLAQIACFADHHYCVGKFERNGRTVTEIEELDPAQSTREIGRMLSGRKLTDEALRNAAELMRAARA